MKRFTFGIVATLSTIVLPLSGFASAASSVDYEKSVGQVDGADTINWVIEATSDGGYVVGGQTLVCYKEMMAEDNGLSGKSGQLSVYAPERVSVDKCIEYQKEHQFSSLDQVSFGDAVNNSYLAYLCGFHQGLALNSFGTPSTDGTLAEDDGYYYYGQCIDYIAKFKNNGAKEWLTTVDSGVRPIAVQKIGDDYRMLLKDGDVRIFSGNGTERIGFKNVGDYYYMAHFNEDGSFIAVSGNTGKLSYYDSEGEFVRDFGGSWSTGSVFPTESGYVISEMTHEFVDNKDVYGIKIYDVSKDLGSGNMRELDYQGSGEVKLVTVSKGGAIIIAVDEDNNRGFDKLIAFDKDGKKIGELDGYSETDNKYLTGYKDFTIGITSERIEQDDQIVPIVKLIKLGEDLTVKYEYNGSGSEFIADVAELVDESLAGVGLAVKGSSKMPVTGDANGGYLRLVAKQQANPTPTPSERPVDNPKTWDAVDTVATIGGIALLGFGVFLRKNLSRR